MKYHQDFVQGAQPVDIIVNTFGTPAGSVQWEVGPAPKMLGYATLPLDVGTTALEGRCATLRVKYLRKTGDKFRFRWFHFQEAALRYTLGLFQVLGYDDAAPRIAFCFNGSKFGMLRTTPSTNIFSELFTPTNQTV